ncbi:MAG TPA: response regulator transcription factor [Treponemataceae bacterium]|nr:response regulator transcription factor [Treponemataceae bacterium]
MIEDEPSIAHFLDQGLREAGWSIDIASDGQAGLDCALTVPYDLVILDLMLPKLNGLSLVRELRSRGNHVPVLILSARDTVEDRVRGLDAGADDYLVKPFSFSELLARIRALMRRPAAASETCITIGDLELDTRSRTVRRGTDHIELSGREFGILEYFMRNADQVVSRTQIAENIWNFDSYVGSNVVDVYIGYLRKKIDIDPEKSHIKTVRGVGYSFVTGE